MTQEIEEQAFEYYRTLAQQLTAKQLSTEQVRSAVQQKPGYALPQVLEAGEQMVQEIGQCSPKRAWHLATVLYEAARLAHEPLVEAKCALALGGSLNRLGKPGAIQLLQTAQQAFEGAGEWLNATRCTKEIALSYQLLTRHRKAVKLLRQAGSLFAHNEAEVEAAKCDLDVAVSQIWLNRYDEAENSINSAGACFQEKGLTVELALCDLMAGMLMVHRGQYKKALPILQQARDFFASQNMPVEVAKCLFQIGWIESENEHYEQALACHEQAHAIFTEEDMAVWSAHCDNNMGVIYWKLTQFDRAQERLERALAVLEANDITTSGATCELNLGNVFFSLNQYDRALEHYKKARRKYLTEEVVKYAALCDGNMALVYLRKGRYSQALHLQERAREALVRKGVFTSVAHNDRNQATTYVLLNQPDKALALYEAARATYQQEGWTFWAAKCDMDISRLYIQQKEYDKALGTLRQAHEVCQKVGSEIHVALCDRSIGDVLAAKNDYGQALASYQRSREVFVRNELSIDAALCDIGLAQVRCETGDHKEAEQLFSSALCLLSGDFPDQAWRCEAGLAQIDRRQNRLDEALSHYQRAIGHIQRARRYIYAEPLSASFFSAHRSVYQETLLLALTLGRTATAIEIIEASKAQTFASLLSKEGAALDDFPARDRYARELLVGKDRLKREIGQLRQEVMASFRDEPGEGTLTWSASKSDEILARLDEKVADYEKIAVQLQQMETAHEGSRDSVFFSADRFLQEGEGRLPQGWSCLEYYFLDDVLCILYLDGSRTMSWEKNPSSMDRMALSQCTSPIKDKRTLIYRGDLGQSPLPHVGRAYRERLYELLIPEEVRTWISPEKLLFIVPHQDLHLLPFQALEGKEGFLAEQATIAYLPSLNSLQTLWQRSRYRKTRGQEVSKGEGLPSGPLRVLLIGVTEFQQERGPLPNALEEVETLQCLFGDQADSLVNEQATVSKIREMNESGELGTFDVIHLATHAHFDDRSGFLSGISLYDDDLTISDIFRLSLTARLVTLSACQGARGEIRPGDELIGLPRALLSAGANALLASLWRIEDEPAKEIMTAFYERWVAAHEQSAAVTLNAIQRAMIGKAYPPYYWASFIAMGIP
jgi:tetratricopeptide (TPR) repeat protein